MRKIVRKAGILLVFFIIGIIGTALFLNIETTDDRTDMNDPVLPEVMVQLSGELANRMCGYRQKMQVDFTRDSVTPLDTTKSLTFMINPYSTRVNALSYEIRSCDGSKVIENYKIKNLKKTDNYLSASIEIISDLRMNQEYSLQITLDTEVGDIYYYTRIINRSNLNAGHYVAFVRNFYEMCMDKRTADDLSVYLEPGNTGTTTNYANISIESSISEVSWGSLKPQIVQKGVPMIKDINETTASVSIRYQISARNTGGGTDYYNVTEFYRMRYTETRIMLLEFYRSAQQVFRPGDGTITERGLILGSRTRDVSYMLNDDISIVAFVQEGELWTYRPSDGKMVRVFSFRRDEDSDFRDNRTDHDIKIIRVGENGDVDFVLSGYMNRGIHEGYSGICVYHYNCDQNVVEEKVFIPGTESSEFLNEDMGTLSYVNPGNQLFLLFAKKLYQVDIDHDSFTVLEENIDPNRFVVSDTSAHAAWVVSQGDHEGEIKEIFFDDGDVRYIEPEDSQKLRTMGFMNEDLIYGKVRNEDILEDSNGHVREGIHTIVIEGFDGEQKKVYSKEGYYVMDTTIKGSLMEFNLAQKSGKGYSIVKKDNIMNNRKASANQVSIELTNTSRTGTLVRLALEDSPGTDRPLVVYAKLKSVEDKQINLDTIVPQDDIFYVYAKGGLDMVTNDASAAVRRADMQLGVVLNRAQQYIWERGNRKDKIQLVNDDIPPVFKTGAYNIEELQEGLGDSGTVVDLTGCTLDSVLYEVSAQRPVIAKTGPDSAVVIVGYDDYNTWLYNPKTLETYPYGMNDSKKLFSGEGNIFLTFVENIVYK